MIYTVYKHIFPNGKIYIGITCRTTKQRWQKGRGYANCEYMNNAIRKYGWENIKHEILFENLTKEEAEQKEIEMISLHKSNDLNYGYNIANGGNAVGMMSNRTKKILSDQRLGETNPMFGKYSSEHHNARKINQYDLNGIYLKTWECSADVERTIGLSKSKIIACCKGKRNSAYNFQWGYHNGTTDNISKYSKYRPFGTSNPMFGKPSHLRKKVKQYDKNKNYIKTYKSVSEAGIESGVNFKKISACCNNKQKSAGGYIWEFTN